VREEHPSGAATGTTVKVFNLLDSDVPTAASIQNDLLGQFCGFLLANSHRELFVDGSRVEVCQTIPGTDPRTTLKLTPPRCSVVRASWGPGGLPSSAA
jgi:hypothetical protein